MSVVDLIIILFAIGALVRGYEIGFIRQLFSTIGFFGGLWLGGLLQAQLVDLADTPLGKTSITLSCTLGLALILLAVGEWLGIIIKRKLHSKAFVPADGVLGSILSVVTLLIVVWLLANLLQGLPGSKLRDVGKDSAIINQLDQSLPPAPKIIAGLGELINPNGFPDVFAGQEPPPGELVDQPGLEGFKTAIASTRDSVVKITGPGCGGLVEGTGFVVDSNLVVTNAHVIAGIDDINVIDDNGYHTAVPIWFNADLDFAVLRVNNLAGAPLEINQTDVPEGSAAAIMGYPAGGSFEADSAVVRDEFIAVGRNIYGEGRSSREVYELQTQIEPGNSGGPVINQNGEVLGMVFAESTNYERIGYALTSDEVMDDLSQAKAESQLRDTGSCARY